MNVNFPPRNTTSFLPGQQVTTPPQPAPAAPLATIAAPDASTTAFTDLDPITQRQELAKGILGEGLNSSPLYGGPLQGLARMGQALVGGILTNKANEEMKTAKSGNRAALKDALDSGDISTLLTSDDPIGQKLGAAILEQQFKRQGGPRLLSQQEKTAQGIDPTKMVQYDPTEGYKILDNEKPMTSQGMISYDRGKTWAPIEGYVDNAKAVSAARRKPSTAAPDQSGKAPWERKW